MQVVNVSCKFNAFNTWDYSFAAVVLSHPNCQYKWSIVQPSLPTSLHHTWVCLIWRYIACTWFPSNFQELNQWQWVFSPPVSFKWIFVGISAVRSSLPEVVASFENTFSSRIFCYWELWHQRIIRQNNLTLWQFVWIVVTPSLKRCAEDWHQNKGIFLNVYDGLWKRNQFKMTELTKWNLVTIVININKSSMHPSFK